MQTGILHFAPQKHIFTPLAHAHGRPLFLPASLAGQPSGTQNDMGRCLIDFAIKDGRFTCA